MARAATNLERRAFVRGLITEASPLTFPENASIDEDNFVLNRDGSRQRRLGMDFENNGVLIDTNKTPSVFDNHSLTIHRWDNVANDVNTSIGVIQIGNNLHFVNAFADTQSTNRFNGGNPLVLDAITVGINISGNEPIQTANANGVLVIASKELDDPFFLTYDKTGDSVSITRIDLKIRDLFGIDDGLDVDFRPSSLSDKHNYNLLNQGWTSGNITTVGFPSNADVQHLGKDGTDTFTKAFLDKQFFGNTPTPKGKFIIDVFDRGTSRQTESGVSNLPVDSDSGAISTVAFHAGRVFYSGVKSSVTSGDSRSPNYEGFIFFTQIIDGNEKLPKCFQEADPTSEHISDLIATDGGTIQIPDAASIFKLISLQNSLLVFAENGVWEVFGGESGFKATDFQIAQVTNVGAVNAQTIMQAEDSIFYWSEGGIYILTPDRVTGRLAPQNITETTIQTFYNDIALIAKTNAVATYDAGARQVRWLYNDLTTYDGITLKNTYNRELIFDTVLGAFYPNTIKSLTTDSPQVAGYLPIQGFINVDDVQNVVVNGEQVQVNGVDVVITQNVRSRGVSSTKYLVYQPNAFASDYGFTFGLFRESKFRDWFSADSTGVDAPAFLLTGYELLQDTQRRKQATYLTMHFNRTETGFELVSGEIEATNPGGCLVQAQWDFANSANSGKFGTQFQTYRLRRDYIPVDENDTFDYGQRVITTKSKLRGSGNALSLRMDTEAQKDVHIFGWALAITGATNV